MMSILKLFVCQFYHYTQLKNLKFLRQTLLSQGHREGIRGLILLAPEGINATLTGPVSHLKKYLKIIEQHTNISIQHKWQECSSWNFKNLHLKIKKEIVQSGKTTLPIPSQKTQLSPTQWETIIRTQNATIIDLRNDYEIALGRFKGAQNLGLKEFKQFPKKLKKHSFSKNKKTLIYCTGGIRCEKALSEMKNQGFKKVFQLKGGILNYLSQFPNSYFEGECFVFDHRVSLNQNLKPSTIYKLCPCCGQPGKLHINCAHCQNLCTVCIGCHNKNYNFCSKNCAYHHRKGHRLKKLNPKSRFF